MKHVILPPPLKSSVGMGLRLKYLWSHAGKETKVVLYCPMLDSYGYIVQALEMLRD